MKKFAALLLALGIVGGTSLAANAQYYNNGYYVNTRLNNPWVRQDLRFRRHEFRRIFGDRDFDRDDFNRRWMYRHDNGWHRGWYRHW